VNYNDGATTRVSDNRLQNKHNRYYFTDSMALRSGKLFVSRLDLNIEDGEIEKPLKPVVRFGMKLTDWQGNSVGVLLLNYLAEGMLDLFSTTTADAPSYISIVNKDGYWLKHSDSEKEWGFMFKNYIRFQLYYPDIWNAISKNESGQIKTEAGVFTFHTVYPIRVSESITSSPVSGNGIGAWKVISHLPPQYLVLVRQKIINRYITITIPLLGLLALICWWLTAVRIKHRVVAEKLKQSHGELEARVEERTLALQTEIDNRKRIENKLRFMASYDSLTGVPNRKLFLDRLRNAMAITRRHHHSIGLLFLDLDGFKTVNDTHGHKVGDQLLKQVSYRLNVSVRESDSVGRYGGDEFVVLLLELEGVNDALEMADKILNEIQRPYGLGEVNATVGCSIGAAIYSSGSETAEELIVRSDEAMYRAKKSGKNRTVVAKSIG